MRKGSCLRLSSLPCEQPYTPSARISDTADSHKLPSVRVLGKEGNAEPRMANGTRGVRRGGGGGNKNGISAEGKGKGRGRERVKKDGGVLLSPEGGEQKRTAV